MPKATVNVLDTHHYDLKSLEEGWIELRRMPYGEWLKRQEMALKMQFTGTNKADASAAVALANVEVTFFEYKNCVADHNLEDENGQKLDFRNKLSIINLDPRIGNEISQYITELHEFDLPN